MAKRKAHAKAKRAKTKQRCPNDGCDFEGSLTMHMSKCPLREVAKLRRELEAGNNMNAFQLCAQTSLDVSSVNLLYNQWASTRSMQPQRDRFEGILRDKSGRAVDMEEFISRTSTATEEVRGSTTAQEPHDTIVRRRWIGIL